MTRAVGEFDAKAVPAVTAKIGYIIPEFPGQTHVWMWREIAALRRWNVPIRMFSTRRPPQRDKARHEFAAGAEAETTYLWPLKLFVVFRSVLWALATRPAGVLRCTRLAFTLPVTVRFRRLKLLALVVPACEIARECARDGITHLHSHTCSNSAILCMMVKRLVGVRFSMTLNANIEWWGGAMLEKFTDAEFTVAITQWLLDQMRRDFPSLEPQQALLGRIGVDTDQWTPGPRAPAAPGELRLITVSRLHPHKGHAVLLDAVAVLRDRGVPLTLAIVGDGPQREELEERAKHLGLGGSVEFKGSLGETQIIELMRRSDVFALASKFEPLGVAYMEAMSMGLATIGTNAGGVPEIMEHGVHGLMVPPEDPAALAEAIGRLAADRALRDRLGDAGRRRVQALFDSRLGAATLYERLMRQPPPRAAGAPGDQ